jgi:membrane protein YdbS with pleckstrin-like domain
VEDTEESGRPEPAVKNEPTEGEEAATVTPPEPDEASSRPSIVDGEEHSVDPRSITLIRVVAVPVVLTIAAGPLIGITIGWVLGGIPAVVYLPLLAGMLAGLTALLAFAYKWPEVHHRHLRYRVDERGVRIRRGVLWRKVISIPTSRVQHTDVTQGPLQRSFGLATLTVHTAGTEDASISLDGLEHDVAKRLRDHLLPDHEADAP